MAIMKTDVVSGMRCGGRWSVAGGAILSLFLMVGCPDTIPPPAAAVLEGEWTVTATEPGDIDFVDVTATFDGDGTIVEIKGTTAEGGSVTRTVSGATTELVDSSVTINVPKLAGGTAIFEGTLSEDQNTMTGSFTDVIQTELLEIIIPGGELTLERIIDDPCDGVTCGDGETCVEGQCVADQPADPCDGVTCETGESCVDGTCVADQPADPCDGVTCETGETCVDGTCVADQPGGGDAAAGEAFYVANGCANCHGADATGGAGPNIVGTSAADVFQTLTVPGEHSFGPNLPDTTQQEADDVAAYLATL